MARGGKRGHKGGRRQFTNPQALENEKKKEEKQKAWRRARGEESSSEDESGSGSGSGSGSDASSESGSDVEFAAEGAAGGAPKVKKQVKKKPAAKKEEASSSEESSSEEDSDDDAKGKGVEGLIEVANPNRAQVKTKKVSQIDVNAKATLSRREREEIEAQRSKAHYQKLHAAGKTDEARADLARLAIIRKQREDAAKKREAERLSKEAAAKDAKEAKSKR